MATRRYFRFICLLTAMNAFPYILEAQVQFTNVAPLMGIQHTYIPEGFWGGGVSFCDFDGDGLQDLTIASNTGNLIGIYKNIATISFDDIASQLNISDRFNTKTVSWADYDNDGDRDLFISNYNGNCKLYRNDGGLQFSDNTADAGIQVDSQGITAFCWADFDNDGWLDLYITHQAVNVENRLYRNNGDGTFKDVAHAAGVGDPGKNPLCVIALDYDSDGWQDIYIGSDRFFGNSMYHNNSDGTFSNVSAASGTDLSFHAMGLAVGDYDNDSDLDIYVSNDPFGNALLRNNSDGTFTDVASTLGVAVNKSCWGTTFLDYDNDSDLDLYVAVSGIPDRRNMLYENLGTGEFALATGMGLEGDTAMSFGAAVGDYNNDGYSDIAVCNQTGPFMLWENSGGDNNWISITLEGTLSNRDAVGSLIEIYQNGNKTIRSTHCGSSYLSQNSPVVTLGVGTAAQVDSIVIRWPRGGSDVARDVGVNQTLNFVEGQTITGIHDAVPVPEQMFLAPNYPNPFNPETLIAYTIGPQQFSSVSVIQIRIFDMLGRVVKTLVNTPQQPGQYVVRWDGMTDDGKPVTSGTYVYRMDAPGFSQAYKMLLIR